MTLILNNGVRVKSGIPTLNSDELIFINGISVSLSDFCQFIEAFLFGPNLLRIGDLMQRVSDFVQYFDIESGETIRISFDAFIYLVKYVITNSDLKNPDVRISLLIRIAVCSAILDLSFLSESQNKLHNWLMNLDRVSGWNSIFGYSSERLEYNALNHDKIL
jgi:hypothetical protein